MKATAYALVALALAQFLRTPEVEAITKYGGGAACRPGTFGAVAQSLVDTDGISTQLEQFYAYYLCEAHTVASTFTVQSFSAHLYDTHVNASALVLAYVRTEAGGFFASSSVQSGCYTSGNCGYQTVTGSGVQGVTNGIAYGIWAQLHGTPHDAEGDPQYLVGWSIVLQ